MPMIRSGRCDECRRRKRKCDEARPYCSGCVDRNVRCAYSNEVSKFIHLHQSQATDSTSSSDVESTPTQPKKQPQKQIVLNIRSSREPPSGNGLYYTFVPLRSKAKSKARQTANDHDRRSASISPPPCSDLVKLQGEFHEVLHSASSAGLRMHTLGRWLEMCIPRIGMSPVLDCSIACLIAGHKARYGHDDRAMRSGRHRYGESLTMLRDTVASGVKSITAETIAATKILMVYEIMTAGGEIHGWISHAYGAINLFLALGPDACKGGEFERLLFYATYAQAWQQALIIGKPSVFDREEWLQIPPVHDLPYGHQPKRRLYVLTKLSRLTALVRAVRENPTDDISAAKATKLAEELLDLDWGADEDWEPQPGLMPTRRAEDAKLVPVSFAWDDQDFTPVIALNLWWANKIMLSGLCQTLISCGAPLEWPTLADLCQEEQRCAMYICMSMDYFASIAPYACMISLQFMQIAWGVFWRQKDFPTSVDGRGLAKWLLRRGNGFMAHFVTSKDMTIPSLAFNTERLMGGPVLPPEFYPSCSGKSAENLHEIHSAMMNARPDPPTNVDPGLSMESGSAFNDGMRNAMLLEEAGKHEEKESLFLHSYRAAVLNAEKDSIFSESYRNTVIDAGWWTR